MSISAISSSLLNLSSLTTASATATTSTSSTSAVSATTSTDSTDKITKELEQLLKDLASNDTAAAKADLDKLKKDTKASETPGSSDSPLDKLIAKLSKTLDTSTDTKDALTQLSSYLADTGKATGSLVDQTA